MFCKPFLNALLPFLDFSFVGCFCILLIGGCSLIFWDRISQTIWSKRGVWEGWEFVYLFESLSLILDSFSLFLEDFVRLYIFWVFKGLFDLAANALDAFSFCYGYLFVFEELLESKVVRVNIFEWDHKFALILLLYLRVTSWGSLSQLGIFFLDRWIRIPFLG